MAQKLNEKYGFSYDNLKVLLGGWSAWVEANEKDPNGYPIEKGPNPNLHVLRLENACNTPSGK